MALHEEAQKGIWFREKVLPLEGVLRRYVLKLGVERAEADDIVQETLCRIVALENWRAIAEPAAFARTVARNLVTDRLRQRKVVSLDAIGHLDLAALQDDEPRQDRALEAKDELRRLMRAVADLPPQCRRVFTLRKIYGLTPTEIAGRTGLAVSTVEKHLVKGLRLCAERLGADDRTETGGRGEESRRGPGTDRGGRRPVGGAAVRRLFD